LVPYDPEEIDSFFIMDGDLTMYVIPSCAVGGYRTLLLRSYARYIVGSAAASMGLPGHSAVRDRTDHF